MIALSLTLLGVVIGVRSAFADAWVLQTQALRAEVDRATGLLVALQSREPTPLDIIPRDSSGLRVSIERSAVGRPAPNGEWTDEFRRLTAASGVRRRGREERLSCRILPAAHPTAALEAGYRLAGDFLRLQLKVTYLVTDPARYRIVVAQPAKLDDWESQEFVQGHSYLPSSVLAWSYPYPERTAAPEAGGADAWNLPMGVLVRRDRFFAYGSLNLTPYLVFAPSHVANHVPCYVIQSNGIKRRETYAFDLGIKVLPRPAAQWREVVRWYFSNTYASEWDPDLPQPRLVSSRMRTLPEGNFALSFLSDYPVSSLEPAQTSAKQEEELLRLHARNLMIAYWWDQRETYPTRGQWTTQHNARVSAARIHDEIARLHRKGFRVYSYFRDACWFRGSELKSEREVQTPPFEQWLKRDDKGKVRLDYGAPPAGEAMGDDVVYGGRLDFHNPEARRWYTERVLDCIRFYNLDGVFWDVSSTAPGAGLDFARVQARVYDLVHRRGGAVIQDWGWGTLSELFCDAFCFECGIIDPRDRGTDFCIQEGQGAAATALAILSGWEGHSGYTNYHLVRSDGPFEKIQEEAEYLHAQERWYVKRILVNLGAGIAWAIYGSDLIPHSPRCPTSAYRYCPLPFIHKLTELAAFSAKATSTPLLVGQGVASVKGDAVGSVWANEKHVLIALYNLGPAEHDVCLRISKAALSRYRAPFARPFRLTLIGQDGLPRSAAGCVARDLGELLEFRGQLPVGELLIAETDVTRRLTAASSALVGSCHRTTLCRQQTSWELDAVSGIMLPCWISVPKERTTCAGDGASLLAAGQRKT